MKYDSTGNYQTQWGSGGSADGQFLGTAGIAVDIDGNVYVADPGNYRIQKFTSNGGYILQWGSFGNAAGQFRSLRGCRRFDRQLSMLQIP